MRSAQSNSGVNCLHSDTGRMADGGMARVAGSS